MSRRPIMITDHIESLENQLFVIGENVKSLNQAIDKLNEELADNEDMYDNLNQELERFKMLTEEDIRAEYAYEQWKSERKGLL